MERKESGFLNERAIVIPKDILNKNSLNLHIHIIRLWFALLISKFMPNPTIN